MLPTRLLRGTGGEEKASEAMTRTARIVLVEDDPILSTALAEQLTALKEFSVEVVPTGADAMAYFAADTHVDLVLMDIGLPDLDGRDVCRDLRAKGFKPPIIMLTAAGREDDVVNGLDAGANDYVTKPFKFAVLAARLRAHLRSHEQSEDAIFQVGPYEFRPAAKLLVDQEEQKIRLTEKEANILKYLYRAGGKPVARETLLNEVWGYNSGVTTHTLETHIYRLRQKIEPVIGETRLLLTEAGGYRLDENVCRPSQG